MEKSLDYVRAGRSDWCKFAAVLALAFALRAGVLCKLGDSLAEDRDNYWRIAQHVAAGDGFVDPNTLQPTAYRPPLYPLMLAGLLSCGGGTLAVGIVQLMLGVATVALTVLCAHNLKLGRASLVAGLFVGCDPLLLYQTSLVMTETTAAFLAVLLLWLGLQRRTPKSNFCLGIVFGLACLCRPTFWAFGGLSAALWGFRLVRPPRWRFGLVWDASRWAAGSIVAGLLIVVSPWMIRNADVMGRPIITTTHGGYTLLLAHNPAYTREVIEQPWGAVWEGQPQAAWLAGIEAEMARQNPPIDAAQLSPAVELARDKWMKSRRRGQYILDKPAIAVRAAFTLLGRMWNVVPLATDRRTRSTTVRLAIGTFYSTLFLAVLIGIARHRRLGLVRVAARARSDRQLHRRSCTVLGRHADAHATRPRARALGGVLLLISQ